MNKKDSKYFRELIAGKKCVVVAPSGFMKGRRNGKYIDSFDFVAKCNIWDFDDSKKVDLGSKCDFVYGRPKVQSYKLNLDSFDSNIVKLFCFLPKTKSGWENWSQDHLYFIDKHKNYNFDFRVLDSKDFNKLENTLSSVPFTGIVAINDLLKNGASEVHAIGFDFHKSGYVSFQSVRRSLTFSGRHNLFACQKYVWELIKTEPRFQCDDHLKSILEKIFKPNLVDNVSKIIKVLTSEFDHFCNNYRNDNILLFRSCNLEIFEIITKCIRKFWKKSLVSVVIQNSQIDNCSVKDLDVISYDSNKPITFEYIKSKKKSLINKNIKVCFIPYNNMELHTYYNIFKILVKLNIEKVFLINLDGFLKEMPHPQETCKEIEFYLNNKQKLLKLRDSYDTKYIY